MLPEGRWELVPEGPSEPEGFAIGLVLEEPEMPEGPSVPEGLSESEDDSENNEGRLDGWVLGTGLKVPPFLFLLSFLDVISGQIRGQCK